MSLQAKHRWKILHSRAGQVSIAVEQIRQRGCRPVQQTRAEIFETLTKGDQISPASRSQLTIEIEQFLFKRLAPRRDHAQPGVEKSELRDGLFILWIASCHEAISLAFLLDFVGIEAFDLVAFDQAARVQFSASRGSGVRWGWSFQVVSGVVGVASVGDERDCPRGCAAK